MHFVSTRGHGPVDLATALRDGPAPDGGLYLPAVIPTLGQGVAGGDLALTAAEVLAPFTEGALTREETGALARAALDFPVPLVRLDDETHVLELTHGPSGAFKDIGARVLARLLTRFATPGRTRTVLVATSGDTGGAVARAFEGLEGVRVVVLFPKDRVSDVQRRQFTTAGGNVRALAVEGSFDTCQALARRAFDDPVLRERHLLTSANSLNVGRLLPQIAYYVDAALHLADTGIEDCWFVVPSGNLGNLTAGVMAATMGAPIRGFVAALNRNDYLAHMLAGEYPPVGRPPRRTLSSAMDVARPSNLERLKTLAHEAPIGVRLGIVAESVDDAATLSRMETLYREQGYLADPHTAVGLEALARMRERGTVVGPVVALATAHPAKFPEIVHRATGTLPGVPPSMARDRGRTERMETIPDDLAALRDVLDRVAGG